MVLIFLFATKEWETVKNKYDKDMEVLRNERVALEEVITTLRSECDNFKSKLTNEFEKNDDLKSQVNRLSKGSKECEEKKLFLLQSLYKRLLPLLMSNKSQAKQIKLPTDIREEKNLEEFIDKIITQLVDRLSNIEEKAVSFEKESMSKEEKMQQMQKKYDEQISKLTKILKEKEIHYVNYKKKTNIKWMVNSLNGVILLMQNSGANTFKPKTLIKIIYILIDLDEIFPKLTKILVID